MVGSTARIRGDRSSITAAATPTSSSRLPSTRAVRRIQVLKRGSDRVGLFMGPWYPGAPPAPLPGGATHLTDHAKAPVDARLGGDQASSMSSDEGSGEPGTAP